MKFKKLLALVLAVLTVLTLATVAMAADSYTIKFAQQYSGILETREITAGDSIGMFPDLTHDAQRVFTGWFYNQNDGKKHYVDSSFVPTGDMTIIAEMKSSYTVKFIVPGSTSIYEEKKVPVGSAIGEFPQDPEKTGMRFDFWYFLDAGVKKVVRTDFCPTSDIDLIASFVNVYGISVKATSFGSVKASEDTAAAGDWVYVYTSAPFGFIVSSVSVKTASGNSVEVKKDNGKFYFEMPSEEVEIDAAFTPVIIPAFGVSYDDVADSAWYASAVEYVTQNNLMDGTGDGKFSPNATTTRAMLVTILYRLDGANVSGSSQFSDVPADAWYSAAVAWANDYNLVTGYGNGTFGPNDPVTREQLAVILQRYAACLGYDVTLGADLSAYQDASSISAYAADAMAWAKLEGLINGVGNNLLKPKGNATRAEIATILQRFCENLFV